MQTFERDGLVFDVIDSGPADGPVVVLLHGFPQFASSWAAVSSGLAAHGYRCLAPDQRGYSPRAAPSGRRAYRTSELVADVLALCDAADAPRVHVVGHDWGAGVAWGVALQHPDRVASLTALSVPHPGAMRRALLHSRQVLSSWYMAMFQVPRLPELLLTGRSGQDGGRLADMLRRSGMPEDCVQRDTAALIERAAIGPALNWYRAMGSGAAMAERQVAVPTLFVWSDGDTAIRRATAEGCRDWVTAEYRYEVLSGISHWIPDEAPDAVVPLLLEHLAAHPV